MGDPRVGVFLRQNPHVDPYRQKKFGPDYSFVRSLATAAQTTVHHDRGEG